MIPMAISYTPAGWPYMQNSAYVYETADYTTILANKLQNGQAAVARAENAAIRAEAAAAFDITTVSAVNGWGGTCRVVKQGKICYLSGRVTFPATGTPACIVLPAAWRPATETPLPAMLSSAGGIVQMILGTNGSIDVWSAPGSHPGGTAVMISGSYALV